jgi:hypothetical protein
VITIFILIIKGEPTGRTAIWYEGFVDGSNAHVHDIRIKVCFEQEVESMKQSPFCKYYVIGNIKIGPQVIGSVFLLTSGGSRKQY